jgi:putative membrane protein
MANKQEELAEERTRLAVQRTVLAEERNYSAWIRTGLASVAAGFAVVRLMREGDPEWLVRLLGITFTVAGSTMFALGFWRYRRQLRDPEFKKHAGIPAWSITAVTLMLAGGAVATLVLIFLSNG